MKLWTKTIASITKDNRCLYCGRVIDLRRTDSIYAKFGLCQFCYQKLPFVYKKLKIEKYFGLGIYRYDGVVKEALLDLKVNGDIELSKTFLGPIRDYLKTKYLGCTLIPIPSIEKQNKKRGFNHVVEIAKVLDLPIQNCLIKDGYWKQSSKKQSNRTGVRNVLKINTQLDTRKRYLLIDDIMTTGETIKACIKLLEKQGCKRIEFLVIAVHF